MPEFATTCLESKVTEDLRQFRLLSQPLQDPQIRKLEKGDCMWICKFYLGHSGCLLRIKTLVLVYCLPINSFRGRVFSWPFRYAIWWSLSSFSAKLVTLKSDWPGWINWVSQMKRNEDIPTKICKSILLCCHEKWSSATPVLLERYHFCWHIL